MIGSSPRERLQALLTRARSAPRTIRFRVRRRRLARRHLHGRGIEVGALHAPLRVPPGAIVEYVDRMTVEELRAHYPELASERLVAVDIVDDGETLGSQPDASADFIVANHFIEHTEDPIGTLGNQMRVLRPGGILYMAVPDRRLTFDSEREPTPLEHLIEDHRDGPQRSRAGHFEEWARHVERVPAEDVASRARALEDEDYSIHFHVWTAGEFRAMLDHARQEAQIPFALEEIQGNEHEFIVILRRLQPPTRG